MFNGAWPAGGIDAAQVPLLFARAVWLLGLLSATGALLFRALEAPTEAGRLASVRDRVERLIVESLVLAAVAWVVWVGLQAAEIAGAATPAAVAAALWPVFTRTLFGQVAAAQIVLVLLAWAGLRLGWGAGRWVPALCGLGAVALQVGHLHAWAMEGAESLLTGAVLLHLCAAAAWLGALLPLWLVLRAAPPAVAAVTVRRFSRRARLLVLVLALTALFQGYRMLGGVPGLFGSTYGWVAMGKAGLFAVLLAIASHNRFSLAPRLVGADPPAGCAALMRNILIETGVGVAVIVAAAVLTALPPGMHEPPIWPFTLRPRLPLPEADLGPLLALGVAVVALAMGLLWRRRRWSLLLLAVVVAGLALPPLGGLWRPATPTSFFRSPTGFTATSVAGGGALFATHCAGCHAATGAAALTPARLATVADGDLFWLLTAGGRGMPGFAAALDETARWQVVDFLRARAAAGSLPVRAPDLDIACADSDAQMLSDLRGRPVRLIFLPGDAAPPPAAPPGADVATLLAPPPPLPSRVARGCLVTDPDARAAYATATGVAPADLAGAALLIDGDGQLREVLRPGADASALAAALARLARPPTHPSGRRPAG